MANPLLLIEGERKDVCLIGPKIFLSCAMHDSLCLCNSILEFFFLVLLFLLLYREEATDEY